MRERERALAAFKKRRATDVVGVAARSISFFVSDVVLFLLPREHGTKKLP